MKMLSWPKVRPVSQFNLMAEEADISRRQVTIHNFNTHKNYEALLQNTQLSNLPWIHLSQTNLSWILSGAPVYVLLATENMPCLCGTKTGCLIF